MQIQLRDEQRLGNKTERELVERGERAEKESSGSNQHQRHGHLSDDERAAHREATIAGKSSTRLLERFPCGNAPQPERGCDTGDDR
jgi:hypothetical protein